MASEKSDSGNEAEMTRPLRLPQRLFAVIDRDAARCRRSANKQIEAILTVYYRLDEVGLGDVTSARDVLGPHLQATPNGSLESLTSEIATAVQELSCVSDRNEMIDQLKELATEARVLAQTPPKHKQKQKRRSS